MRTGRFLSSCAIGALLASIPGVAAAQALQGTPTVVVSAPSTPVIATGAGYTGVLVRGPQTVINWAPFDTGGSGTIDFLPAGSLAEFADPGGTLGSFTVLNRILPVDGSGLPVNRPVAFNGTVIGLSGNSPGGNIWFYSPTGIIAGPTSVFNVGSLILTTNDIQFVPDDPAFGTTGSIYGPGGLVQFQGPAGSTGFVEVQSGAQLNAIAPSDAYVALVAPRVVQGGTVTANGQIAYIAAEAVDMTINAGLFDFTVVTGTTDANGVVHTGTTTGPASTGFFTDQQRIAMVAVPKNDALTMLLSGSIGYTPAVDVTNDGSSIVLSAGFATRDPIEFVGADDASIQIGPGTFRNVLRAWATDSITVLPQNATTQFGGTAFLNAGATVEIDAIENEFVIADGDLFLNAGRPGTGGTVDLFARTAVGTPGGVIDVAGRLSADASSYGILPVVAPPLDGQGGTIIIDANGGRISASSLGATADGNGLSTPAPGGTGTGGTIDVVVRSLGTIEAPFVDLFARGRGGSSDSGDGGDGFGGDITLRDESGTLRFGSVLLGAHGNGGDGGMLAGNGTSGTAAVSITGQAQTWDYLAVLANAFPGRRAGESLGLSGSATGQAGAATLAISGDGALTLTSGVEMIATAQMDVNGQPGFAGQGGGVDLSVTAGGELAVTGNIYADASALFGGEGIFFDPDTTPTLQGGQVSVTADGGNITAFGLEVRSDAEGLYGTAAAGDSTGGTVTVSALNGGRILLDDGSGTSLLELSADGLGAPGPNPSDAFGGTARLIAEDGSVTVLGDIAVSASGRIGEFFDPPPDGPGHNATGGTATVELRAGTSGTASIEADDLTVSAIGDGRLILTIGTLGPGGDPIRGDGGDGTGGSAGLTVAAGTLTVNDVTLDSSGTGGGSAARSGGTPWVSGDGFGGISEFAIDGGIANIVTLDILSNGNGGDGSAVPATGSELASVAGEGTGGTASLALGGSAELRVTDATLEASGFGAPGMDHNGSGDATDGGSGTGGSAALSSAAGWSGSFQAATLALRGNGIGGVGGLSAGASTTPPTGVNGNGGAGNGGNATIDFADGAFALGPVTIEANGTGGYSGDASSGVPGAFGGYGTGGAARFALIDSAAGPSGARSLDSLRIEASGYGGFGSTFIEQSSAGQADLTVSALDGPAALTLPGSLSVFASGPDQLPGAGIDVMISGAPLLVGGEIVLSSEAPVTVAAAQRLQAGTFAALSGFTVTTTGLIQSGDQMFVEGVFGINADRLISGDTTSLDATRGPGPILVADLVSAGLVTANGRSIDIRSSAGLSFAEAIASGGDLYIGTAGDLDAAALSASGSATLETSAGNVTTNDLTAGTFIYIDAFGSADLGNLIAGTDAAVTTRGGSLTVGNVTAGDDIWLSVFGTNVARVLTAGNLVTTGLGADNAAGPGELFGEFPNSAGPAGNVARLRSSGSLVLGDMQSPGHAILVADAGTTTAGDLSADEALIVLGRGNIALDAIDTDGAFYVANSSMFDPANPSYDPAYYAGQTPVRTGGGLTVGSAVQAGDIAVAVAGTATAPSWTSAGRLLIDSGGLFTSGVTVSAGGNASITADNGIDLTALTSGGTTLLRSTAGTIDVDNLLSTGAVTAQGQGISLGSPGSLTLADVEATAGSIVIDAAGNLSIGEAFASGTIQLDARGTFALSGTANGSSIDLISADIALGTGSRLGVRGATNELTLRNGDADSETFIGGSGGPSGAWILDRNEATRMFTDDTITILADGDIAIDDLALSFGAGGSNIGTGGLFEISTPEVVDIIGDVALTTSGADDTFRIDPRRIALNTETGSIAMTLFAGEGTTGGTPQGRLELVGDRIVAATGANITQLETMTDLDAISALLDVPGGTGEPLSAGTIRFEAVDSLFIQNSGASDAFADRRGFAANGLEIVTESNATQIAINGRILSQGGAVTGLEVTPLVSINGAPAAAGGQFDPRSTINGCVIGADCNTPENPEFDLPTSEDVDPIPPHSEPSLFVAPLIELAGTEPLITPPLVDEPITGVGNDDLWEPRCDPDEEDGPCPEEDGQP